MINIDNITEQLEFCNAKINELDKSEELDSAAKEKLILEYAKQVSKLTELNAKYQLKKQDNEELPKIHLQLTYQYEPDSLEDLIEYAELMIADL